MMGRGVARVLVDWALAWAFQGLSRMAGGELDDRHFGPVPEGPAPPPSSRLAKAAVSRLDHQEMSCLDQLEGLILGQSTIPTLGCGLLEHLDHTLEQPVPTPAGPGQVLRGGRRLPVTDCPRVLPSSQCDTRGGVLVPGALLSSGYLCASKVITVQHPCQLLRESRRDGRTVLSHRSVPRNNVQDHFAAVVLFAHGCSDAAFRDSKGE